MIASKPEFLRRACCFVAILCAISTVKAQDSGVSLAPCTIEVETILRHDDGEWLWFHPRAAAIPGLGKDGRPAIILTLQKHLQKSDFYSGLHVMRSDDLGATWSTPDPRPELAWQDEGNGVTIAVCDVTPGWHAPTGKLLAVGIKVRYKDGVQLLDKPRSHDAAYTVYDPRADTWTPWRMIDTPERDGKFFLVSPGCVQWLAKDGGDLLVPMYFRGPEDSPFAVTVLRCGFDGTTISYIEHGDELSLPVERGLVEPSLALFKGKYYLTLRNDVKGYVSTSTDGLHFEPIRPWTFDDGEDLGSYNTQQHWLTHGDELYLVYTRRGANNDHVFRHRAPLFMGRVDPERLCVLRDSERVLIPERGATLGNSGACAVTPTESWVTVSEGIWNDDARKRGAQGDTYIARIRWALDE